MAVVQNIATNAKQTAHVNDFAIEPMQEPKLIPFGSVHPDCDWRYELDRLADNGIKGIKLHPDYQDFYIDEVRMQPIYEYILKKGFILLFPAGLDIGLPNPVHAEPERTANVLGLFAGEKVVLAHMGGFQRWDAVEPVSYTHLGVSRLYPRVPFLPGRYHLPSGAGTRYRAAFRISGKADSEYRL